MSRKSRRTRFVVVAERRTNKAVKAIRLLGKCANRLSYEYRSEEVDRIFDCLIKEIKRASDGFKVPEPISFTLSDDPSAKPYRAKAREACDAD